MKKLLLLISAIVFLNLSGSYAQSTFVVTDVANGNSVITNGMVIYRNANANIDDQFDINIKNTSSNTHTYKMRMFHDLRHIVAPGDSSDPYFCFAGLCYTPSIFTSTKTQTLTPNQDAVGQGFPITIHYEEASVSGISSIRYRVYETTNASTDKMEFTIQYNDPAGVRDYASLFANVSDVYPSPSSSKASITVNAIASHNNASVSISNSLGSVVSLKTTDLSMGKNVIPLDVENLSSGIYFTTIVAGNSKIVKKFIINK